MTGRSGKLFVREFTVEAPPADVFDLLADVSNELDWNPDTRTVRRLDEQPLGAGSEWVVEAKGMGTIRTRLEQFERPSHLLFATSSERMDTRFSFDFASEGPGTRVTVRGELMPKGAMRVLTPLLGPVTGKMFAKRPAQIAAGVAKRAHRLPEAETGRPGSVAPHA